MRALVPFALFAAACAHRALQPPQPRPPIAVHALPPENRSGIRAALEARLPELSACDAEARRDDPDLDLRMSL